MSAQNTWQLKQRHLNHAYSLYLKGLAESVFWNARRRNLTLPEDFGADEKEIYTDKYFKRKAIASLSKARTSLVMAGISSTNEPSDLFTAIGEMITNFNTE